MSHSQTLQLLTPLALGATSQADQILEGNRLDLVDASAGLVIDSIFPDTTDYISIWERVLDINPVGSVTRAERLAEILFRLRTLGRLDRQYYIDIAATVGYDIAITELKPLMAGWAETGSAVLADAVRWIWQVTIAGGFNQYARAGSAAAGEPLAWYRDKRHLNDIFNDLKPAHTQVTFI